MSIVPTPQVHPDNLNTATPQPDTVTAEEIESSAPFSPETTPVEGVPAVSDAELEKQALAHPGSDGDPSTPE